MAVVNTKSTQITNDDIQNQPVIWNDRRAANGTIREAVATVEVAAADEDGSVYRFVRVHSSWRPSRLTLFNDAIAGATDYDLGLYYTDGDWRRFNSTKDKFIDVNCFADGIDLTIASPVGFECLFQSNDIANIGKTFWEIGGLTADPGIFMDICITANTVGTAAGTLSLAAQYVGGA